MRTYWIRFNNAFMPYIWIRVPRFIWSWAVKSDWYIDGAQRKVAA